MTLRRIFHEHGFTHAAVAIDGHEGMRVVRGWRPNGPRPLGPPLLGDSEPNALKVPLGSAFHLEGARAPPWKR